MVSEQLVRSLLRRVSFLHCIASWVLCTSPLLLVDTPKLSVPPNTTNRSSFIIDHSTITGDPIDTYKTCSPLSSITIHHDQPSLVTQSIVVAASPLPARSSSRSPLVLGCQQTSTAIVNHRLPTATTEDWFFPDYRGSDTLGSVPTALEVIWVVLIWPLQCSIVSGCLPVCLKLTG